MGKRSLRLLFIGLLLVVGMFVQSSWAVSNLELPYPAGVTYSCSLGYDSNPYHHNNDRFALDFVGNKCDSWDKPILSVAEGTVIETGFNNGYGKYVVVDHGGGYKSKYGHLNQIIVSAYQHVYQGEQIGTMGRTGTVIGSACDAHRGLHLHFVMYYNGAAFKPEPMSGHSNFVKDGLYTSRNCYNPMTNFNVGKFINGYESPASLVFATTFYYNGSKDILGYPISEVYQYPRCNNPLTDPPGCTYEPNYKVWAQDYEKNSHIFTLVKNQYRQNPRFNYAGVAYPVHGRIRKYWQSNFWNLGAPVTNEYAASANGKNYVVQWFEPSQNSYVGVAYWINNDQSNPSDDFYNASSLGFACTESLRNSYIYSNVGCPGGDCGIGGDGTEGEVTNSNYSYQDSYVCDGWVYGSGSYDYWDWQPVNPRTQFQAGETVMLLAQLKDVYVDHQWKTDVWKDGVYQWEYSSSWQDVDNVNGWPYSNFTLNVASAAAGSYEFKIFLSTGSGFSLIDTKPFTVASSSSYIYEGSAACDGWVYGSGSYDYWDWQPVNPRTQFMAGSTVMLLAQLKDVYVDHQWKTEVWKDGAYQWEYSSSWQDVDNVNGWGYSNFTLNVANADAGSYQFKVYLNTGSGFSLIDTKSFIVSSGYIYTGADTCDNWVYGSGSYDYWDWQPVNPRTQFQVGQTVMLLTQLKDVFVDHQWKTEVWKDGAYQWEYSSSWQDVDNVNGWSYSNFTLNFTNASAGNYAFKIFLSTGNGFFLVDTKSFVVN